MLLLSVTAPPPLCTTKSDMSTANYSLLRFAGRWDAGFAGKITKD